MELSDVSQGAACGPSGRVSKKTYGWELRDEDEDECRNVDCEEPRVIMRVMSGSKKSG